jgi:putative protease
MAITCPRCGAGYDVTLFQFGHRVRCACGAEIAYPGADRRGGHTAAAPVLSKEGHAMAEVEVGRITHYFSKIGVAAMELSGPVRVGDTLHIKGHTSDFTQQIDSMQLDNQSVQEAGAGQSVGFRVAQHARQHDLVYKIVP